MFLSTLRVCLIIFLLLQCFFGRVLSHKEQVRPKIIHVILSLGISTLCLSYYAMLLFLIIGRVMLAHVTYIMLDYSP